MDVEPHKKRRQRQPRVKDNPMALLAREVMDEAERTLERAHRLADAMEPHLLQRIGEKKIYQYTTKRPDRNVPPGDVLLAAALVAGISLDNKLGVVQEPREIDEVRAEMAQVRREVASLREELAGTHDGTPAESPADDVAARAERAAQRRAWAQRSQPAGSRPAKEGSR